LPAVAAIDEVRHDEERVALLLRAVTAVGLFSDFVLALLAVDLDDLAVDDFEDGLRAAHVLAGAMRGGPAIRRLDASGLFDREVPSAKPRAEVGVARDRVHETMVVVRRDARDELLAAVALD